MEEKVHNTEELYALLFRERSLVHYFQRTKTDLEPPSFSEYITALCQRRGEVPEHIIARANLEKSYGHQLFSGKRRAVTCCGG